jgi:hypothetical protein
MGWGALDDMHACDKSGFQADVQELEGHGLIKRFHKAASLVRKELGFGTGRAVARAAGKKLKYPWRQPLASHSQSTRLVIYESSRISENFLKNIPVAIPALACRLQAELEDARRTATASGKSLGPSAGLMCKAARQRRADGRAVLDVAMLLFVPMLHLGLFRC